MGEWNLPYVMILKDFSFFQSIGSYFSDTFVTYVIVFFIHHYFRSPSYLISGANRKIPTHGIRSLIYINWVRHHFFIYTHKSIDPSFYVGLLFFLFFKFTTTTSQAHVAKIFCCIVKEVSFLWLYVKKK